MTRESKVTYRSQGVTRSSSFSSNLTTCCAYCLGAALLDSCSIKAAETALTFVLLFACSIVRMKIIINLIISCSSDNQVFSSSNAFYLFTLFSKTFKSGMTARRLTWTVLSGDSRTNQQASRSHVFYFLFPFTVTERRQHPERNRSLCSNQGRWDPKRLISTK